MNAPTRINSALNVRDQFPAIENWHYLDSAATAQKPQAVIDAIARAYGPEYATVHRGVYQRSSDMTGRYEAARAAQEADDRRQLVFDSELTCGANADSARVRVPDYTTERTRCGQ